MRLSVIIPIFNVQEYLEECIDSVLEQKYCDLEIILINDGSTDSSKKICEEYKKKYSNIKLIDKENSGLSDTRNIGIKNASGEYVIFLDSDDYWNKNFLYDISKIIEKNRDIDLVFFRLTEVYGKNNTIKEEILKLDNKKIIDRTGKEVLEYILTNNSYFGWYACRLLVKRKYLIDNELYFEVGRCYEDALWSPKVFLKAKRIYYYNKAIYNYRLNREGQITANISYKSMVDSLFVANHWLKEIDKYSIDDNLKNMILSNISVRYFYTIWFCSLLIKKEQKEILIKIRKNKECLKYINGNREYLTLIIIKVFGFSGACKTFKLINIIRRLIS